MVGLDVLVIVILAEDGGRNRKSNSIWKLVESIYDVSNRLETNIGERI